MPVPTDRQYTPEHEWIQIDGEIARVGITEFAANALGDVVYIELPPVGTVVTSGQPCGEIESTKSVSDLFAPADGEVLAVNDQVVSEPGQVNTDPYGTGWLFELRLGDLPAALDAGAYEALTEGSL